MKRLSIFVIAAALAAVGLSETVQAGEGSLLGWRARRNAMFTSWQHGYYSAEWGMPVALVVPPTAERQVNYGWGVGNTRVTPIWHQFHRDYPGPGVYECGMYHPRPSWPSDTLQMGVYYVRGPW